MSPTHTPRVKVCRIGGPEEAWAAVECGASALGFAPAAPGGPGELTDEQIGRLALRTPPCVATFLLTSRLRTGEIMEQQFHGRANTIQLCDPVELEEYVVLREALRGVSIVQTLRVTGEGTFEAAMSVAPCVDAILLDAPEPDASAEPPGGGVRTLDWTLARRIRQAIDVPLFLAGGLTPENVAEAVREVGPFGVDVCAGVRTAGQLDRGKLERFFKALNSA